MEEQLEKLAAQTIRSLYEETEKLAASAAHETEVRKLTFELVKNGSVPIEDLESTFSKLASKTKDELEVFKKALELTLENNTFFKVSSKQTDETTSDPLTKMLFEDI